MSVGDQENFLVPNATFFIELAGFGLLFVAVVVVIVLAVRRR